MRRTRTRAAWPLPATTLALVLWLGGTARAQDLAPPAVDTPGTPGPASPPPPAGAAQPEGTRLASDEKKDSGRGLEWVYLNADAGFSYIDMASFSSSSFGVQNTSSQGPTFGVGAGIRLFILTIGVRANLNELSSFNLWQLDGELGLHIPLGHWDPYFGLHGGYCFVGSLDDGLTGSSNISITGGDAGIQLGVDYYFNHFVSIGIEAAGSVLFLQRPPAALPSQISSQLTPSQQAVYQQTGDSVGLGVAGVAHLGFHL